MQLSIDIVREHSQWRDHREINKIFIKKVLRKIFAYIPITTKVVNLSVSLTDDTRIQELNAKYLNKHKPTNILSFPLDCAELGLDPLETLYLGDLVLSYQTIKAESLEPPSFINHFTHLLIHGVLHLLGYDHETDSAADIMENLEIKILESLAISNPYA